MMKAPSTDWRERISPDEEERFARQGKLIAAAHAAKNARFGNGRFLHRKEIVGAAGTLEVFGGLPEHAAQGVFSKPGMLDVIVRLSNGAFDIQADTKPDIRGFALRILGVSGQSALGGSTDHQDFLLINHDVFGARDSDEFVEIAAHAARGQLALLWHLIRTRGLGEALKVAKGLAAKLGKPFAGFAAESFNTAVPHQNGPYAVKVVLSPSTPAPAGGRSFAEDIRTRVATASLSYDLLLHFFTDEASTPIEDNVTAWSRDQAPTVRVGRLTLTKADVAVEAIAFDPWGGLEAHRPLGEVMRARKAAYHLSARARAAR